MTRNCDISCRDYSQTWIAWAPFWKRQLFCSRRWGRGRKNLLIARDLSNEQVGSFRLVEKIGAGGMGEVYLATQEAPLQRKVAIKLLREGMGTAQIVARFRQEQQAISLMNHPNIATILDAGTARLGSNSTLSVNSLSAIGIILSLPWSMSTEYRLLGIATGRN